MVSGWWRLEGSGMYRKSGKYTLGKVFVLDEHLDDFVVFGQVDEHCNRIFSNRLGLSALVLPPAHGSYFVVLDE